MKSKLSNIASNTGLFVDGNPKTGELGTIVTAKWLNDVQARLQDLYEEQKNILALAGLTLVDNGASNQLAKALTAYINNRVAKSGDTMTGVLNINRNAWEKLRFTNSDNSFWRFESAPVSATEQGNRFNWVFSQVVNGANTELGRIAFPAVTGTETAAYRSWVAANFVQTKELGNNEDLNTVLTAGDYFQQANVRATASLHYPVTQAGVLEVKTSATGVMQLYTIYNTGEQYFRRKYVDNWSEWKKVTTFAEIDDKAPIVSPTFTGTPKAPTPAATSNDTSIATTAYVTRAFVNNFTYQKIGNFEIRKYPDGTMIQSAIIENIPNTNNGAAGTEISFPLAFTESPVINTTIKWKGNNDSALDTWLTITSRKQTNTKEGNDDLSGGFKVWIYENDGVNNTSRDRYQIHIIAIGRWK